MWSQRVKGGVLLSALAIACGGRDAARDTATSTKPPSPAESPAVLDSAPAPLDGRQTILFLGTSLTAGLGLEPDSAYPQQIQRKIDASKLPYQVVNSGVSGETSAGLLRRLDWVLRRPADVVVVETGANDGLRGLPVEATRATIGNVLARIRRERPNAKILLVGVGGPPNLGPGYASACEGVCGGGGGGDGARVRRVRREGVAG